MKTERENRLEAALRAVRRFAEEPALKRIVAWDFTGTRDDAVILAHEALADEDKGRDELEREAIRAGGATESARWNKAIREAHRMVDKEES